MAHPHNGSHALPKIARTRFLHREFTFGDYPQKYK